MASSNFSQETKQKVTEVKGKAEELASSVSQAVQGAAADVTNKAQDWAGNMATKAQETAAAAVDKTNEGIAAVGHRISSFGGTVREAAPKNGAVGSAASAVADKLQAGGEYLEGHGMADMGKDLSDVVRRYPFQSILVGIGVGCLLGMVLRKG